MPPGSVDCGHAPCPAYRDRCLPDRLGAGLAQPSSPVLQDNVHFARYGALAQSSEILGRVFTPLTAATIRRDLARSGKNLNETPLDLSQERFLIHVPSQKPPGGYGLHGLRAALGKAQLPQGWGRCWTRPA